MGKALNVIFIFLFLAFVDVSCKKEEDSGRPTYSLSNDARLWFAKVGNGVIYMKSSNGLSEGYNVKVGTTKPLCTVDGKQSLGEEIAIYMEPSLGDVSFTMRISNADAPENIGITYSCFSLDIHHYITQKFPISDTKQLIYWFTIPFNNGASSSGLQYVGDTIFNGKSYNDIFLNKIHHPTSIPYQAIKEIYVSKSLGLVAFNTHDSVSWVRE